MRTLLLWGYQSYFWLISRLFPRYAAAKALDLLFTVSPKAKSQTRLKMPDETVQLTSGAHLLKWEGKRKECLLLVHGWNGSLDQFSTAFNYFNALEYTIYGLSPAGHGLSTQAQSHPGLFVDAIKDVRIYLQKTVDIAIGHSMGGGALALAASELQIAKQIVLIATPASFLDVVKRFAGAILLGRRCLDQFLFQVEQFVGRPHASLEVIEKVRTLSVPAVVMHDELDREVPFNDALRLNQAIPEVELLSTRGVGHNRILKEDAMLKTIVLRLCSKPFISDTVVE